MPPDSSACARTASALLSERGVGNYAAGAVASPTRGVVAGRTLLPDKEEL
jgi:hypothetical protein